MHGFALTITSTLLACLQAASPVAAAALPPGMVSLRGTFHLPSDVQLSADQIVKVTNNLATAATKSWEIGTRQTALLELNAPETFLYVPKISSIPPKQSLVSSLLSNATDVFDSVEQVLSDKPDGPTFFHDGASGDPPSVGIPFLLKNWTKSDGNDAYGSASTSQLEYLLNTVPRSPEGAISHRADNVQLWADFLAMAPPFIAYYGALQANKSLLDEAYKQLSAYRSALLDSTTGLYQHIVQGSESGQDHGFWSTGNAWAISGMLRVLRIIQLSPFASDMEQEQADIISWTSSLLTNVWTYQHDDGALPNYYTNTSTKSYETASEASATALMVANTYRLAQIVLDMDLPHGSSASSDTNTVYRRGKRSTMRRWVDIPALTGSTYSSDSPLGQLDLTGTFNIDSLIGKAEKAREYIVQDALDADGWLTSVVNPLNWRAMADAGTHSAEGQSFVLMMQAAYRDFWAATSGQW